MKGAEAVQRKERTADVANLMNKCNSLFNETDIFTDSSSNFFDKEPRQPAHQISCHFQPGNECEYLAELWNDLSSCKILVVLILDEIMSAKKLKSDTFTTKLVKGLDAKLFQIS